jgi:hypothetical protein
MRKIAVRPILIPVVLALAACGTPPNPLLGSAFSDSAW